MKPISLTATAFGPFVETVEVDFAELGKDGLFLITGKTGAGKTTLLDAVCFALYGQSSGGMRDRFRCDFLVEVIEPKTVVEFVFEALEQRWRVTRTPSYMRPRQRGEGVAEEKQQVELQKWIDGEWRSEAAKWSEANNRVKDILGFTAVEFRQVIMLPQGKFREFLEASSKDRSKILGKIFVQSGRADTLADKLQGRAATARQDVERHETAAAVLLQGEDIEWQGDLDAATGDLNRLLQRRKEELKTATTAKDIADKARQAAQKALDKAEADRKALAAAKAAADAVGKLEAARESMTSRKKSLAQAEKLAAQQPVLVAAEKTADELKRLTVEAETRAAAVADAGKTLASAKQAVTDSEQRLKAMQKGQEDVAPQIKQARTLDQELATLRSRHDEAEKRVAAHAAKVGEAEAAITRVVRQLGELLKQQEADAAAMAKLAAVEMLAPERVVWRERVVQAKTQSSEYASARIKLDQSQELVRIAQGLVTEREEAVTVAATQVAEATTRHESAVKALKLASDVDWDERRKAAQARKDQLVHGRQLLAEYVREDGEKRRAEKEVANLRAKLEKSKAELNMAEAGLPAATEAVKKAESEFARMRHACDDEAERLRAALEDGLPCPVCGSQAHPFAHQSSPELRALFKTCEVTLKAAKQEEANLRVAKASAAEMAAELAESLATAEANFRERRTRAESAQTSWQAHLAYGKIEDEAGFLAALETVDKEIADCDTAAKHILQLRKTLEGAARELAAAETARTKADTQVTEAAAELKIAAGRAENAGADAEKARTSVAQHGDALAPLLTAAAVTWDAWLNTDAAKVAVETSLAAMDRLYALQQSEQKRQGDLRESEASAKELRKQLAERQVEAAERAKVLKSCAAELHAAGEKRGVLLNGESTDDFVKAQAKQLETAQAEFGKTKDHFATRNNALKVAETRLQSVKEQSEKASQTAKSAQQALSDVLAQFDLQDAAAFRAALWDEEKRQSEADQINQWEKELHAAEALAEDRKKDAAKIETPDVDALTAALTAATGSFKPLEAAWTAANTAASNVRTLAKKFAEWREENGTIVARKQTLDTLDKLARGVLPGSIAAKLSFRNWMLRQFLHEVLETANARLRQMTGWRYSFQLAPLADGGLEIDVFDEHTGQPRGVDSLSGGEGFMASMALALGLADLVTQNFGQRQLDTIFIDEGFGSLDPETLETAMGVLEDLREGGRTVGMITHVSDLQQRPLPRLEVSAAKDGQGSTVDMQMP